ncbi:MAG: cellulase family glycosylhydrolase [Pyrinomonadaceae bacterium MAG19_C2-C3]|nr:cellulase family glycosylhydrolase [Pyrinomonadaceae bacterium MAG19_C2-C3]
MHTIHKAARAVVVILLLCHVVFAAPSGKWSERQANEWYRQQPFLVGSNYNPATAINELEMWQADTFDPKRIDLELGWAENIGMNTMRVYLHDLPFKQDPEGFKNRINTFLDLCAKHNIKPMLVLFDSCWDPFPVSGKQREPRPGVHNSGWMQSPGKVALETPAEYPRLEAYVRGIVGAFAADKRILAWDIWNEPDNMNDPAYISLEPKNKVELVLALLPQAFQWAREAGATQPLTSAPWKGGDWSNPRELTAMEITQLNLSDIISFHNYEAPESFERRIKQLQVYNRPILCTEYMARGNGSTFEGSLPIAKRYNVAAINWGFVQGKTQTHLPWDSWRYPYTDREPSVWFHEVFRTDGTPYRTQETELIKRITGKIKAEAASARRGAAKAMSN